MSALVIGSVSSTAPRMGPANGSGAPVTIVVQAIDSKDVSKWLRSGAAAQIQSALNDQIGRYSGKSVRNFN